ncbi:calcium and integrin-binding family member 2-like [Paramacrobiotus metropolitanus]|uniref:calcium and integrin-binding family member 2-like n=1 Tax=Paramacrobiotus metropolitanus TaxID=2943436 RepID=UPI002445BF10|nr:calcium and integrin-binding family member 2-like [Paramacrobiotus metropolitanus]
MGNAVVTFSQEQLEEYQDVTYFNRNEILSIYRRFKSLAPDDVPMVMTREIAQNFRLSRDDLEQLPELKENPFKRRILAVFSEDGSGNLSFNDFLEMFSVFSERATKEHRAFYAFKIYDYDDDGFLGISDVKKTVRAMTRDNLDDEERSKIAESVMKECNMDDNSAISFSEFENVVLKAAVFELTFHIRL